MTLRSLCIYLQSLDWIIVKWLIGGTVGSLNQLWHCVRENIRDACQADVPKMKLKTMLNLAHV